MTIKSAGVVFTAILRIGITAGIELGLPDAVSDIKILKAANIDVGTGIVAGVWLDIAQFRTNITAAPATNGNTCELRVIEEYILGIGAGAGATLTIGNHVWGPELEIEIPIYHTTLTDICAVSKTAAASESVTSTAAIKMRQDVETTTTVTEITQTAIQCLETGLLNCPASLRTTSTNKVTKTLTAVVTSDADPVFTAENTVVTAIAFGTNAHKMEATSGSPVSYVPKPTETSGGDDEDEDEGGARKILNATTGGVSNKLIIGVSVGVGVPLVIAIIAGIM